MTCGVGTAGRGRTAVDAVADHVSGRRSGSPTFAGEPPAAADRAAARIGSAAEALEVAATLSAEVAPDAARRDRDRVIPVPELAAIARSGLLGITAPGDLGGADVAAATLVEVMRRLAEADPNIAQILQSHFLFLDLVRLQGTAGQRELFFGQALAGQRIANAQSERGTRTVAEDRTTLELRDDGGYGLSGHKYYATGSLHADWLAIRASLAGEPAGAGGQQPKAIAFVPADTSGVRVEDDWDGLGQRTTGSGSVILDDVRVPAEHVVPFTPIFSKPTVYGAFAQVLHAAIDVGIARAALTEARTQAVGARPWFESGVERATDDLLLIQQAGELEISVRAAEALLREAASGIDHARAQLTEDSAAAASIATAVAKVSGARAAVEVTSAMFEFGGTRAASAAGNLSRYWRDARTHTLHDPARWKVQHIGRWTLNGVPPPRHGLV